MKSKNKVMFFLIFVITAVLVFVAYQGIGPGHILSYRNIEKGLDLSGGVYIVYEAQREDTTNTEGNALPEEGEETTALEEGEETTLEQSSILEEGEEETLASLGEPSWEAKMDAAISMIQNRADSKGWTEANVYKEGTDRIRIEIPGIEDAETAVSEIGQTAKLSFRDINGNVVVEGKDVINATQMAQTTAQGVQEIVVSLEFNEKGAKDFEKATEENIGNPILIELDGNIISSPIVNDKISDGQAIITGTFTAEEAHELASLIRAGSLPFELEILEMNTIGATLGANALNTSVIGGAVGILLVLVFIFAYYKAGGFAADLALVIYISSMIILLNGLNVVLTLHGIAGIILSVGMAVDANVIIFERIREELNMGKGLKLAIDKGFSRAFPAILDGNITTLIAGGVLFWLGSGPIKGFAQTLMIGIILSMFTALFVTKFILKTMVEVGIKNPKLYGGK